MTASIGLLQPYGELPPRALVRYALKWQAAGLLLLVAHVVLTKESVGFAWIAMAILAGLYYKAPLAGLVVYFQFLLYQNWIISLFAVDMNITPFKVLQGTNFAAVFVLAAIAAPRLLVPKWYADRDIHQMLKVILFAVVVATGYGLVGAARSGVQSSAVYYREFVGPLLAIAVGLDVGRVWGYRTIATCLLVSIAASIGIALVEVSIPAEYYTWINAADFINLKGHDAIYNNKLYGATDVMDANIASFFNISGSDFTTTNYRFLSTIMHSISYGYVLAVAAFLVITLYRAYWLLLLIPMLVAIGVKGSLLLFVCVITLWFIWSSSRSTMMLVISTVLLMSAYVAIGLLRGMAVDDYHVLGFLGGWHGFLHNPLGRGIGVGGNLSSTAATGFHWQGTGGFISGGVDFAVESAVGVLLYQMGIGAFAIFAAFLVLVKNAPFIKSLRAKPSRSDLWFIAVAVVMVNGVYQEEAYAPTAAALIMLVCAVLVINGQRRGIVLTPRANRVMREQRRAYVSAPEVAEV
jgi:hypothetical protein